MQIHVTEVLNNEHIMLARDLTIRHHDELGGSREFDSSAIVYTGKKIIEDNFRKQSNAWLAMEGEKAIGLLFANAPRVVYSWRQIAVQEMLYIIPERRGSRAFFKLVKAFEEWAEELNCEQIYMTVEHNVYNEMTQKTSNMMERMGYPLRGHYHIKVM